jgi:TolA-binding protein
MANMHPLLFAALLAIAPLLAAPVAAAASAVEWSRAATQAERAGRYGEALTHYTRILQEAPNHYLSRTAEARAAELRAHADDHFVPYGRYQALLSNYSALGSQQAVAEAQSILEAYPHASITPELLYWLGNEFREARGEADTAAKYYRALPERFPEHPLVPTAMDRLGRMLQAAGRPMEAAQVYRDMETQLPGINSPAAYALRQAELTRHQRRIHAAAISQGILAAAGLFFFWVGGHRIRVRAWLRASLPRVGFALALGIPPAAFLWIYDDLWSPSLTALAICFGLYSLILGALATRVRVPEPAWYRSGERAIFGVAAPMAILYLIVHAFELWEAFLI